MNSMTGYGRATAALGNNTLTVVVSSVNRKALDLGVRLPSEWEPLEGAVGEAVRRRVSRGKIQVGVELSGSGGGRDGAWDEVRLAADLDRLAAFAATRDIPFQASPELLWELASAQRGAQAFPDAESVRDLLLATLGQALDAFARMRAVEGASLLEDLSSRLALLRGTVGDIAGRAPLVAPAYRELLLKRLREGGLDIDLDDERVLKEIALFADRCDITEEITRFRSHLDQFETLLGSPGEIGRKSEFILQEMGREANTMGAKSNDLAIAKNVIELKNELERIREQIANVE
jgi:uncharacterized protein (TIGR00255 family)